MPYPLISIIVPIYNVELHLSECLDSVLAQSFTHWECICINDGSTDSSMTLLQSYASRDPRIIAVHTENHGVSAARNRGLNLMRGAYFTFLDGDDRLAPDALEHYHKLAREHDADIVEASTLLFSADGHPYWSVWEQEWSTHPDRVFTRATLPSLLNIRPYVWNAFYRRSLWKRAGRYFAPHLSISEDYHFKLSLLANVTSAYVFTSKMLYHYRKGRADSAMSTHSSSSMASNERRSIASVFELWLWLGRIKEVQIDLMDMIFYSWRNRYHGMSKRRAVIESIQYSCLLAQVWLTAPSHDSWRHYKLRQRELLRIARKHIRHTIPAALPARLPQQSPRIALGFSKAYFALSPYDHHLIGVPLAQQQGKEARFNSDNLFRIPLKINMQEQKKTLQSHQHKVTLKSLYQPLT